MSTNKMASDVSMNFAVKAASYNMILQIMFRVGTFFMNALLLRYISREILGVVNVRLTLLYTTILFVSREAFRKACLTKSTVEEEKNVQKREKQKLINLIWLCVAVGIFSLLLLLYIWTTMLELPSFEILTDYKISCVLFGISSVIELFVEPLWIYGQKNSFIAAKVVLEGILVLCRCLISTLLVLFFPGLGLHCFAIGYVISSLIYVTSYYGFFCYCIIKKVEDFPFSSVGEIFPDLKAPFDYPVFYSNLVLSFYKQSLLKQFLTEGERYVMTIFNVLSFGEQGIYDVINNLGSLAARFIFMPIEESYYVYFSQMLIRGKSGSDHQTDSLKKISTSLSVVLKFVSLAGFIILVFGYSYSFLLLDLYGGKILSENEGPRLLQMYCFYVLVIAINGITECFMFAGMSKEKVDSYNYKMLMFSLIFLLASLIFTNYFSALGFIMANCLNMCLRISQSALFIDIFFKNTDYRPLTSLLPSPSVSISLVSSFVVTYISAVMFCYGQSRIYQLLHVMIGGVCLLVVMLTVYLTEHELVSFAKNFLKSRKKTE